MRERRMKRSGCEIEAWEVVLVASTVAVAILALIV